MKVSNKIHLCICLIGYVFSAGICAQESISWDQLTSDQQQVLHGSKGPLGVN